MRHLLVLFAALVTGLNASAAGLITTAVGTGTPGHSGDGGQATAATLNNPFDVAFDALGNLYLSDTFQPPRTPRRCPVGRDHHGCRQRQERVRGRRRFSALTLARS